MKRFLVHFLCLCFPIVLWAQDWESIKNNPDYLYGEGFGYSIAEADKQALAQLVSKIAVNITSSTSQTESATLANDQLDEFSQFSSSVNTYSQATLTNTEFLILSNEPDAHVGRWIKRSEIEKIFESRIAKIKEMVSQALIAETKGKVDDALRNYFWAFTLLKSLQHPNDVTYPTEDGNEQLLITWIPAQINTIFDQIKTQVVKRDGNDVELFISYRDKPVNSIDYTYFDGRGWSNIYSAKDGRGVLELMPGNTHQSYQIKYEFEYRGQAQIDKELESVINVVRSTPMRAAYVNVSATEQVIAAEIDQTATFSQNVDTLNTVDTVPQQALIGVEEVERYEASLATLLKSIESKQYAQANDCFTEEGLDIYQRMIQYGKARVVGTPDFTYYRNGDYVMARGLQLSFSFQSGLRKSFVEDMVFSFDSEGKICNIAFGLGNTAIDDILNKGQWSQEARVAIMNFLENYKTAYGLKRLDYIRSIFDDQAVIIVGNVVRSAVQYNAETGTATVNPIIKKNRYTKDQYLKQLEHCFKSNEYINIRFANNDVYKLSKGGELYAIQIAQDYYSTNYGDKGYLFLMVDINNPEKPIIKVRTWQPEKDPNFGLYGPGDF